MIMCMSDILCVTNRKLCREDFLTRIEQIAACHPAGIILREKDLLPEDYQELASAVMEICEQHGVKCILLAQASMTGFTPAIKEMCPDVEVLNSPETFAAQIKDFI